MDLRAIWEEAVDEGVKVVRQAWYTKGNELRAVCVRTQKTKAETHLYVEEHLAQKIKG